jgi:hypothetical protein
VHAETRTSVLDGSTRNLVDPTVAAATATGSASGVSAATCSRAVKAVHDRTASRHRTTFRCSTAAPNSTTTLVRCIAVSATTRRPTDPVNRARPTDNSRLTLTPAT